MNQLKNKQHKILNPESYNPESDNPEKLQNVLDSQNVQNALDSQNTSFQQGKGTGLAEIIRQMSQIRHEAIQAKTVSNDKKDEYLALAAGLSKALPDISDKNTQKRIQNIIKKTGFGSPALYYDPLAEKYWQRKEKGLTDNLDSILFAAVGERFDSIDAKHHIFQAIKMLKALQGTDKQREEVYDSVLPYLAPVRFDAGENIFTRLAGWLIGSSYDVSKTNDLTVRVEGDMKYLDTIISDFSDMGYTALMIEIAAKEKDVLKARYPNARIINSYKQLNSDGDGRFLQKCTAKLIKYTQPASSAIIGALPYSLKERLCDYISPHFPTAGRSGFKDASSAVSTVGNLLGGAVMAIGGLYTGNGYLVGSGGYLVADSVIRFIAFAIEEGDYPGSSLFKIGLIPVESYLNNKDRKEANRGGIIEAELLIGKSVAGTGAAACGQDPGIPDLFDRIARIYIPESVEKNLVHSEANHNAFGAKVTDYLKSGSSEAQGFGAMPANVDMAIDRQSQSVIYHNCMADGGYQKDISLLLFNGARYVVATIGCEGERKRIKDYCSKLAQIIDSGKKGDDDISKLAEKIRHEFGSRLVKVNRYENSELMDSSMCTAPAR